MSLSRRAVLAAPLALAACGRAPPVTLPFREVNDHIAATVSVSGREAVALIDNGAPITSLDQDFAASANLARSPSGMGLAPLDLRLGAASLRVHPFLEDMTEAQIAADAPLGAILGYELFKTFTPAFSFTRGQLTLHPRQAFKPDTGALVVRSDGGPGPHPSVDIVVEGQPVRAFVDLGCSAAVAISPTLAARLPLSDGRALSTRQVLMSLADGLELGVSRRTSLRSLTFAGRTFADVPVDVLPGEAKAFAGLDAVIGVPLLRRFDIAFALPERLVLKPNARLATPFERRMTGLQTKPDGANLLVRHVAEGSPAEALGFVQGDLIAAIDGEPPLMRTLRNAREGQVLAIRLADGGVRNLTGARYY